MALVTRLTRALGLAYPIVQAPMAGGMTTPALVAAVSNAGGLGSFAAATVAPDAIRAQVAAIRAATDKPFLVNLFVLPATVADASEVAFADAQLAKYRREVGLDENAPAPAKWAEDFEAQFETVLDLAPPVFSSTFGAIGNRKTAALKARGVFVVGTATNVAEAKILQEQGVDAIWAQGGEAGGHRGTFVGRFEDSLIGTVALVPQIVDAVAIPVIAAGWGPRSCWRTRRAPARSSAPRSRTRPRRRRASRARFRVGPRAVFATAISTTWRRMPTGCRAIPSPTR
jgi:nitronate monooxygenase